MKSALLVRFAALVVVAVYGQAAAASVDLTITSVSGPAAADGGATVPITFTVASAAGASSSVGMTVSLYLSRDQTITTSDTLLGSFYDMNSIAPGASATYTRSVAIPGSQYVSGSYYIGAIVYAGNGVVETDDSNNALAGNPIQVTYHAPDLSLTAVSGPTAADGGATVPITFTVASAAGASSSVGVVVSLYLSRDQIITTSDTPIGSFYDMNSIAPGGSATYTRSVAIPGSRYVSGSYYIGAIVYAGNNVVETDDSNNALVGNPIEVTYHAPDLSLTAVSGPTSADGGATAPITFTVASAAGASSSIGLSVSLYLSRDQTITTSDTPIGSFSLGSISPGASATYTKSVTIPGSRYVSGAYYLGGIVSTGNGEAETDDTNNALAGNPIQVTYHAPDLSLTAVSGPTSADGGATVPITFTVASAASASSSIGLSVSLYLSRDQTITTSDTPIGSFSLGSISPGASATYTKSVTIPGSQYVSGAYYLGGIVFTGNGEAETDNSNNALVGNPIQVTYHAPDLSLTAVSGPAAADRGATVPITFTVASAAGASSSIGLSVSLYLSRDQTITTSDTLLGSFYDMNSIAPGASATYTRSVAIPGSQYVSGSYYIGAIVYAGNGVVESDVTNNAIAGNIVVVGPDLEFAALTGPSVAPVGSLVSLSDTVVNAGSPASGFTVAYYLSPDPLITAADIRLGSRIVSGLAAGGSSTAVTTLQLPPGFSGQGYLGAIADADGQVAEADETNNVSLPLSIVVANPDTTLPEISFSGLSDGAVVASMPAIACFDATDEHLASVTGYLDDVIIVGSCASTLLEGDHALRVRAFDEAGNMAERELHFAIDVTPPDVFVLSPTDGSAVSSGAIDVVVAASDTRAIASVTVNGAAAVLQADGLYHAQATLPSDGSHLVEIVASDAAGNTAEARVSVVRDATPPVLTVSSPAEGLATQGLVVVAGQARDASAFGLKVNGTSVTPAADGRFSRTMSLPAGTHEVAITATDTLGNSRTVLRHVRIVQTISLTVTDPPFGFHTQGTSVYVGGRVSTASPPAWVVLHAISDQQVAVQTDGSFYSTVPVAEGPFTILVTAHDSSGGTATKTVVGTRNQPPADTYSTETTFTYDEVGNLVSVGSLQSDPANCHWAGHVCYQPPHSRATCTDEGCGFECDPGFVKRNGAGCVALTDDPNNCGELALVCDTASSSSFAGCCTAGRCGFSNGGACVDTQNDPDNCGWIGHSCTAFDGLARTCSAGSCATPPGRPQVDRVNGVAAPGEVFRVSVIGGALTLEGSGLDRVDYVDFEDWGRDTVDWRTDGMRSVPLDQGYVVPTGDRYASPAIPFDKAPTTLTIPAWLATQSVGSQTWYKVRLHFDEQGADAVLTVDVAVSFGLEVDPSSAPPQISSVSPFYQHTYRWWWPNPYDPATGLLQRPMRTDQTRPVAAFSSTPVSVLALNDVEVPILRVAEEGFYLPRGLNPDWISRWDGPEGEFRGVVFVFPPYDPVRGERIDSSRAGLIVKGANLWWDSQLFFTTPENERISQYVYRFSGERLIVTQWDLALRYLDVAYAFIGVDSERGNATAPWPIIWFHPPVLDTVAASGNRPCPPYLVMNTPITATGKWLGDVDTAFLSGPRRADGNSGTEYLRKVTGPPAPGEFQVVDGQHIILNIPTEGLVARGGVSWFNRCDHALRETSTNVALCVQASAAGTAATLDSDTDACVTLKNNPDIGPVPIIGEYYSCTPPQIGAGASNGPIVGPGLDLPVSPGGDCTNSFCP